MIVTNSTPSPFPLPHREFGERLRQARLAKQLTLRALSDQIGYRAVAISQVEQGNIAEFASVLLAMCVELGVKFPEEFRTE